MSREMNEIYGTVLESNVYIRKYKVRVGPKLTVDFQLSNSPSLLSFQPFSQLFKNLYVT